MVFRLNLNRRRTAVRLIGAVLCLSVCAALFPIPLWPTFDREKERSQPYPCQNHPCGCHTAEQCWKKCCCLSNAQKVAWAEKNKVDVPEFVLLAAAKERYDGSLKRASCCHQGGKPKSSCHAGSNSTHKCKDDAKCTAKHQAGETGRAKKSRQQKATVVIGTLVQKCQGQSWSWSSMPWTILAPPPSLPQPTVPAVDQSHPLSESGCELCERPPTPPPKRGAAVIFIPA